MRYTFRCPECGVRLELARSIHEGPPTDLVGCPECAAAMDRDWQADMPMIDVSGCRDHDDIPETKRVASNGGFGLGKEAAARKEAGFKRHIEERRKQLADGGNKGSIRHTHSVPADLYHGKIRETNDRNYWKDPKNLDKHRSCKVSK